MSGFSASIGSVKSVEMKGCEVVPVDLCKKQNGLVTSLFYM